MTVGRYVLVLCLLMLPLTMHANCPPLPQQIIRMEQSGKAALEALFQREQAKTRGEINRNTAILSVLLPTEKLDARTIEFMMSHQQTHPDDQFAKLYQGYAWVFSAADAYQRKHHLRAAEFIKRGYFLIDEAVDSEPDNWRLRYLRLRLDAFVPARLGRHVVALKDAGLLLQVADELPAALRPLIFILQAAALESAGQRAAHTQATVPYDADAESIDFSENVCWLQRLILPVELNDVLGYALEQAP